MNSPTPSPVTIAPCAFDDTDHMNMAEPYVYITTDEFDDSIYQIRCGYCDAAGPAKESELEAIEAWNRRPRAGDDVKASPVVPVEKMVNLHNWCRDQAELIACSQMSNARVGEAYDECANRIAQLIKEAKDE